MAEPEFIRPEPLSPEADKARKSRNLWLALALFGFVILVGAITMVRLGESSGSDFYYNVRAENPADEATPALPPGMTPDQAAPPPGLTPDPQPEGGDE